MAYNGLQRRYLFYCTGQGIYVRFWIGVNAKIKYTKNASFSTPKWNPLKLLVSLFQSHSIWIYFALGYDYQHAIITILCYT